jgi:acetate kinase
VNVLVLNCGSSSVKFQVIDVGGAGEGARRRARGQIERIGAEAAVRFEAEGGVSHRAGAPGIDHAAGVEHVIEWLRSVSPDRRAGGLRLDAIGHRVVHGGERFARPAVIDDGALAAIEALEALAPLHNAPSLAGIRACRALLGAGVPMVAVFDTAFHLTLPERAWRYAIPGDLARRHGIRRFGFHGTSYRWVLSRYCALTGTPPERATLVALHLGAGCSAAAIQAGRSIDTSMGFTPLEGLVMGTRSGDLDPALVGYLARKEGVATEEVEGWLNHRSGLLGLSGRSSDIRDLLAHEQADPRARLAVDLFCYRARKYVGAYLAALGGADALVFTGGIGEHAPEVRRRICAELEWSGLVLDPVRNAAAVGREAVISAEGVRLRALVIPTDEELVIARDTVECLGRPAGPPPGAPP